MKKIMFNHHFGLEQAVLNRTKTRTMRRIGLTCTNINTLEDIPINEYTMINGEPYFNLDSKWHKVPKINQPIFKIGEVVAISQAYKNVFPNADFEMIDGRFITESAGWNNKMFVKAEYMPHQIQITDIKLERVQDISDEDCIREGIKRTIGEENRKYGYYFGASFSLLDCFETPREAFAHLIDKVSGKGTWDKNEHHYVYYFKLIR